MTYVITRSCCSDAACVPTCPVNCIHPAPGEPGFGTSDMLYIDPDTCIECSACVQVCPVNAIAHEDDLTPEALPFLDLNAAFYRVDQPGIGGEPQSPARREPARGLRVAVVGTGPAGSYAVSELLNTAGVEVNVFERLMTPLGLVRFGVAPDHQTTKTVGNSFPYERKKEGLTTFYGVEIGEHLGHEELLEHHHAVIYAVGAPNDRALGIPGESLPGSRSAAEFVSWYNGHPDAADLEFDLSVERAVIIGNGNVALDIARVLAAPIEELAKTDIADHALDALRESKIREVLVVARRGPEDAAYSASEFIELTTRPDLTVTALTEEVRKDLADLDGEASGPGSIRDLKISRAEALGVAHDETGGESKQIVLRYRLTPKEIVGSERVESLRFTRTGFAGRAGDSDEEILISTGLVIRSVGFTGRPVPDLPFDETSTTVPNDRGRVGDDAPGAYVTGWIKRGARGVIGTNKTCAAETVTSLLEDFAAGGLATPAKNQDDLTKLIESRSGVFGLDSWKAIDIEEREAGRNEGRPRVKIAHTARLMEIANRSRSSKAAG